MHTIRYFLLTVISSVFVLGSGYALAPTPNSSERIAMNNFEGQGGGGLDIYERNKRRKRFTPRERRPPPRYDRDNRQDERDKNQSFRSRTR